MVHSYRGGTGKTLLATNLAGAYAKNEKVCLLDFDFSAPSLHGLLKVPTPDFWINDLLNDDCDIDDVITEIQPNLYVGLANPDAEIFAQYADSFTDAAKGKAIANQMYENGADIVYHASGGVGDGVIEAAKEQDKFAIGVDRDQNSLAPEHVITSAMKRVDNAIFNVAELLVKGEFPGGTTVVYGLKEGGVGIAPTSYKLVPADILEEVEDLKAKVIAGEIVVPSTPDTFAEWMK